MTFKRLCKNKYEHFEPIGFNESEWIEKCNNGGLLFCEKGIHECYGYDFSSFYPSLMGQFKFSIPFKARKELFLKELDYDNIDMGFYRVKITSTDNNINEIFAFSKYNVYTHYSLQFAIDNKDVYDIDIELIIDDKPNACIYYESIQSLNFFGKWFDTLYKLKLLFPKNKLVKDLMSSL
jgi:hypothetical protein